jgi:hypothetical protein
VRYTVIWATEAEDEIARLWMEAAVRGVIADAADGIDEMLRRDPQSVGESREDERRILFVWPLGAIYRVREADRIVNVSEVWRYE